MGDILDLLLREDIEPFRGDKVDSQVSRENGEPNVWRGGLRPPPSLVEYIHDIRRHSLRRDFISKPERLVEPIPHTVAVGMKPKKRHEVEHLSHYVASLTEDVTATRGEKVSHIVDFGSGLNYLGRTLASAPYNKDIIAIERRQNNITSAKGKDIHAKLAKKTVTLRNKKEFKARLMGIDPDELDSNSGVSTPDGVAINQDEVATVIDVVEEPDANPGQASPNGKSILGCMHYVEHDIQDGYLEPIIRHIVEPSKDIPMSAVEDQDNTAIKSLKALNLMPTETALSPSSSQVMVVSLHSCGNLVHHGIRSLVMNPSVVAIAMIGCCYNLMTERLGPMTYKLPILRSLHPRLEKTSTAYDPHGFPMSQCMEQYTHDGGNGIRLNITARMMAVQAPYNWGPEDSEMFFTRHFYRALLQRILVDYEVIPVPGSVQDSASGLANTGDTPGTPLIVGSLRKSAFESFSAYTRAAISKLIHDPQHGESIRRKVAGISDDDLNEYVNKYKFAKKQLSIAWTLMAFSAGVAESIIVTDRWLFLREQKVVKHAWVEPVFEYAQSPRNLVVVGIKK
ncbi:conserved hypothetical protein [Uncinocarpus reesii 1704]|uniref:Methyltransferase domain-containing protein n=1 Tax=Uncinocarpus reesii (strain UAMH 1704) TaxID=336963 RepID=C4JM71_UNCRE|nr:uncharacterized protein UREG_03929 [Uncinocarpus reesii 1704]EEP79083.1 conserved hypothetical protein [Uncinocarpus reesii 1704]